MKLRIVAVGDLTPRARRWVDDYLDRLGSHIAVEEVEVESSSASSPEERRREEAGRLEDLGRADATRIAVDRRGREPTSHEFADWLERQMVRAGRDAEFVVGGAHGLDPELRRESHWSLSLSSFTLPHELARVVLAEQLYRAMSIVRGEPYHK